MNLVMSLEAVYRRVRREVGLATGYKKAIKTRPNGGDWKGKRPKSIDSITSGTGYEASSANGSR
ncbi:MAG: hypothetical protein ACRERS_05485, partial [Methylococcales bacterium]